MFFIAISALIFITLLLVFFYCSERQQFFPRPVMTQYEQHMYLRLKQAFPQYHILAQVAFSALITNQNYKIRSKFNRKVTDFVLLNSQCQVIAIIELDDPSHLNKKDEDAFRDKMLQQAGYPVYRYTQIPTVRLLQHDIST